MSGSVIVLGGGAAGLAAAIAAAEHGCFVTVLERLPRVGKKILLTGNGRCNLGHTGFDFSHYHGSLPQAEGILAGFDTAAYFRKFGLLTRADSEGRLYPMSGTAASVLDALRFAAEQRGVRILCEQQADGLTQTGRNWKVSCGSQVYAADTVILAAGGSAAPNCGTDGNLFPILRKMGYAIQQPRPSLCPVPTDAARVRALKGLRVRAAVSVVSGGKILKNEAGEVQFTDSALSGICVFNLSRLTAESGNRTELMLDLLPDFSAAETEALINELISLRGTLPAGDLLTGILPKRIGEGLVKSAGGSCQLAASDMPADVRRKLCALLKDWRFPVTGTAKFAQAQVTAGGVKGECVTGTLESRLHRGLFFCGELLDLDGDCGGYNLTWCWASGETAGNAAAASASTPKRPPKVSLRDDS
ncbi:MAG: aminoacetone oxidase family FAD-binding enzyme [Oscillospiraceae bacterium]|nr:aminoacetone oxidase family FAD-binding enzyme [Oscillospiraceae bacterium]